PPPGHPGHPWAEAGLQLGSGAHVPLPQAPAGWQQRQNQVAGRVAEVAAFAAVEGDDGVGHRLGRGAEPEHEPVRPVLRRPYQGLAFLKSATSALNASPMPLRASSTTMLSARSSAWAASSRAVKASVGMMASRQSRYLSASAM